VAQGSGLRRASTLQRPQAILLLAAIAVSWGTVFPVIKVLLQDVTPLWTLLLRLSIGTIVLFALSISRQSLAFPKWADTPVVFNVTLLHMVGFAALVNVGLQFVPAGRSVVLGYTTPLWVMVGARIFLGEALTPARLIGVTMGMLGIALLFNPLSFDWRDRPALTGNSLVLLGSLCWAASILHVRAHKWVSTPFELVPWQAFLATCILAPLAVFFEGVPHIEWSARLILLLLYGGTVGIALPYWAMQTVNRDLPAITTALALLAVPIVGVVCSSIGLGEPIGTSLILAMVLIISGIAIGIAAELRAPFHSRIPTL